MGIPTAEEFFKEYSNNTSLSEGYYDYLVDKEDFKEAMLEFAKLHCEALRQAILDDISADYDPEWNSCHVDRDAIREAYPITNIK